MGKYDEIVKHLMDRFADDFAMLSFGTQDVKVLETLDSDKYEHTSMVGKMCREDSRRTR